MFAQTLMRAPLRMRLAFSMILVIGIVLAARLFYWQILQWDKLSRLAEQQQAIDVPIPARRGDIQTRDGLRLATDLFLYTISVAPPGVTNPEELAKQMGPILGQSPETILTKLNSKEPAAILARGVPVEVGTAVQDLKTRLELKHPGLGLANLQIEAKPVRNYPGRTFAAQVVGYVNAQRQPAYGVEQYKDAELRGTDGKIHGAGNALHDDLIPFDLPTSEPATDGADITLTIDSGMQHVVETELANAIKDSRAASGSIIVLDPKTGAVLALAVYPTADLNAYFDPANAGNYVNSAVSAQYEPGSVFKVITVAAALDAGTVTPASVFDDNGWVLVGGRELRNHNQIAPGRVNLTDVLRLSLNVEAVKMSVGLGVGPFYRYVRKFGFGIPTRVELAAEAAGDVKSVGDGRWRDIDLGTNAFGQGIAVTPLQMTAAIAAVANQGRLMRPYIVQETHYPNGKIQKTEPELVRQVIRPETAQVLTRLLADAIIGESTNKAIVPGYRVAGKTGTAQIPIFGTLDPRWTIASFVGYLPADDPRFVILVKLDKPQTSEWGSQVASPVFASVAKQLVTLVGLPPDAVRLASK